MTGFRSQVIPTLSLFKGFATVQSRSGVGRGPQPARHQSAGTRR